MNKNQVHGAVKDLAGKVQEEAGKLVGNKVQEAKGLQKQVAGKAEVHLGDAKEAVKDAKEVVKRRWRQTITARPTIDQRGDHMTVAPLFLLPGLGMVTREGRLRRRGIPPPASGRQPGRRWP